MSSSVRVRFDWLLDVGRRPKAAPTSSREQMSTKLNH